MTILQIEFYFLYLNNEYLEQVTENVSFLYSFFRRCFVFLSFNFQFKINFAIN